jgi:hypothetical protein
MSVTAGRFAGPSFEVHGTKWETEIDAHGIFYGTLEGTETTIYETTLEAVKSKASDIARKRKAKLNVEFTSITDAGYVRDGVVTGLHSANGNMLVTWDDGTKEQHTSTYGATEFPRLTREQADEAAKLKRDLNDAQKAWQTRTKELTKLPRERYTSWTLRGAVEKAVKGDGDV